MKDRSPIVRTYKVTINSSPSGHTGWYRLSGNLDQVVRTVAIDALLFGIDLIVVDEYSSKTIDWLTKKGEAEAPPLDSLGNIPKLDGG